MMGKKRERPADNEKKMKVGSNSFPTIYGMMESEKARRKSQGRGATKRLIVRGVAEGNKTLGEGLKMRQANGRRDQDISKKICHKLTMETDQNYNLAMNKEIGRE